MLVSPKESITPKNVVKKKGLIIALSRVNKTFFLLVNSNDYYVFVNPAFNSKNYNTELSTQTYDSPEEAIEYAYQSMYETHYFENLLELHDFLNSLGVKL